MRFEFSDSEMELIEELLQLHQETLLRDIARADHRDYKLMLRARLKTTEGLMERLKAEEVRS